MTKILLSLPLIFFMVFISINESGACTTAIISGKATIDGRPLLLKHRDSNFFQNKLMYFDDGKYNYIGLVNSEDLEGKEIGAIWFVGGNGSVKHLNDSKFHNIAKDAVKNGKILGAICFAPAILAKAGVLSDRKATVWSSNMDKSTIKILEEGGAQYVDSDVTVDGDIVTANGPSAAEKFAKGIINKLNA